MRNRMRKLTAMIGITVLTVATAAGCSGKGTGTQTESGTESASQVNSGTGCSSQGASSESPLDASDMFTSRDKEVGYDESECEKITLADGAVVSSSSSVEIDGSVVTIKEEGVYIITGSLSDGQIRIDVEDSEKVQLVLDNVSITNGESAAIYAVQADKVFLTMSEGSENTLSTTGAFVADGDTNVDGVIFAKCDLTLNGNGTMTVNSQEGHGIVSKDDLVVTSGTYSITAGKHALSGKDSVRVADGTIDATTGKDGIHSENTDDDTKGFVYIAGGTFRFNCTTDGIDSSYVIQIDGGTFDIYATEKKGLKAFTAVYVNGGDINIEHSYEGIEAQTIVINDGNISLYATDDGFNAATKTSKSSDDTLDDSTADDENRRGAFGGGIDEYDESCSITINGGVIEVNADGDGIDSNGNLYVNGGEVYVSGPTSDGDGALDMGGEGIITGGIVVAAGSSGMAENFGSNSTQCAMLVNLSSTENASTITLKASDGSELVTYTPQKAYSCVVISTPDIAVGETYTVVCGSSETTVEMTDTIYGESSGMGGGMGGRGMGGGPGRGRMGDSTENGMIPPTMDGTEMWGGGPGMDGTEMPERPTMDGSERPQRGGPGMEGTEMQMQRGL